MLKQIMTLLILLAVTNSHASTLYTFEDTVKNMHAKANMGKELAAVNLRCVALTELTIEIFRADGTPTRSLAQANERLEEEARRHLLFDRLMSNKLDTLPFTKGEQQRLIKEVNSELKKVYEQHKSAYDTFANTAYQYIQQGRTASLSEQQKVQDDIKACAEISYTQFFRKFDTTEAFMQKMLENRKESAAKSKQDQLFKKENYPFEHSLFDIRNRKIGNVLNDTLERCVGLYDAMVSHKLKGLDDDYADRLQQTIRAKKLIDMTELQEVGLSIEEAYLIAERRVQEAVKRYSEPYAKWQKALNTYENEGNGTFTLRTIGDETSCAQLLNSFPDSDE